MNRHRPLDFVLFAKSLGYACTRSNGPWRKRLSALPFRHGAFVVLDYSGEPCVTGRTASEAWKALSRSLTLRGLYEPL